MSNKAEVQMFSMTLWEKMKDKTHYHIVKGIIMPGQDVKETSVAQAWKNRRG